MMDADAPPISPPPGSAPSQLDETAADGASVAAQAPTNPALVAEIAQVSGASSRLPTKAFFSDRIDRWLFLLFAGGGITVIVFMKLVIGNAGLFTALPPAAVLCLYPFLVRQQRYFRLHPDRLGDNCYYMGFIFTLTSLSVALIQLQDATVESRAHLLETLIGNFGIALSSTILGIALRVFFIQFRREIEDEEEQLRLELQTVAANLKDGLGLAVNDLESFRLRTVQVLNEQLTSAADEFSLIQKNLADKADMMSVRLAEVQLDHGKRLENISDTMLRGGKELGQSTSKVVAEMRRLISRIDRVDVPPDLLVRHISAAEARISQLASALERLSEQDHHRADAFERATDEMLKQLAIASDTSKFTRIDHAAEVLEQRLTTLTTGVSAYQQAVDGLAEGASREQQALLAVRQAMEQDARDSAGAVRALQETLSNIAHGIAAKLG
jgi:hypothetical protein